MASGVSLIALLGSPSVAFALGLIIDGGAIVTVPGTESSPWHVGFGLHVGSIGTGTVLVENGGIVGSSYGYIGDRSGGGAGFVTVSGAGSQWNASYGPPQLYLGTLAVGNYGTGTLLVENGGIVSSILGYIGYMSGSTGSATVSGAGSQWNNSGDLYVGRYGTGTLLVENGGVVSNINGTIGSDPGVTGSVTVSGAGSQWNNSGNLIVARRSLGTLLVENGGMVQAVVVEIAYSSNSSGILAIGGLSGSSPSAPGTIAASVIRFGTNGSGLGDGHIVFNHTDTGYTFASQITDTNSFGTIDVRAGVTTLTGVNSSIGTVTVNSGELAFGQNGLFTTGAYTATTAGAITSVGATSQLAVTNLFRQTTILNVAIGSNVTGNAPVISAVILS